MKIHRYPTLPSTNTLAKEMLLAGVRDGVIVADRQTAGRGRMGRQFFSENGLFMSILYAPDAFSVPTEMLTSATAVAVCRALRHRGLDIGIKWVNDLYFENKKACGILTEAVSRGNEVIGYVVGIGINLKECELPEELREIACSLSIPVKDRDDLIQEILSEMGYALHENPEALIAVLSAHSIVLGRPIRFFGAKEGEGVAVGLDKTGGLIVETSKKERITLTTGEISVRVKNS